MSNFSDLQLHQKYDITQYEELGFHSLLRWKMIILPILTSSLSHMRIYFFNLGVKGSNALFTTYRSCARDEMSAVSCGAGVSSMDNCSTLFIDDRLPTFVSLHRQGVVKADYLPLTIEFNPKIKCLQPTPVKDAEWIEVCGPSDKACTKCP